MISVRRFWVFEPLCECCCCAACGVSCSSYDVNDYVFMFWCYVCFLAGLLCAMGFCFWDRPVVLLCLLCSYVFVFAPFASCELVLVLILC